LATPRAPRRHLQPCVDSDGDPDRSGDASPTFAERSQHLFTADLGLDQAIEVARQNIGTDYELWGYAAGTYADVLRVTGTYGSLVPPRGATWDTWVWAIVFSRPIEVCPPVQGASCDADVQLSTVYIDFRTGSILDTVDASAVPAESLPSPFFVLPPQGSPKPQGS